MNYKISIRKTALSVGVLLIVVLMSSLTSFSTENKEVIIDVNVIGAENNQLIYAVPIGGNTYLGFSEKVNLDSMGKFQIRLEIDRPGFVQINNSRKVGYLFVQPDNHYQFMMDHNKKDSLITVLGRNETGQNFYNQLDHYPPEYNGSLADKLSKDIDMAVLETKIMKMKNDELATLNKLYRDNQVDFPFYEIVTNDIKGFYNLVLVETIRRYFIATNRIQDDSSQLVMAPKRAGKLWMETFEKYPIINAKTFNTRWWYPYADHYIQRYMEYSNGDSFGKIDIEKIRNLYKSGEIHTYNLKKAQEYLTGDYLEFYTARYIHFRAFQIDYEKELITLFEKFKADFPKSEFHRYIEPFIQPIKEYHESIKQDFGKEVKFIESGESIRSLNDAMKSLKGKVVYVDIWATTCGPCKKEFENNDGLKALLKSHDVAMFYLSIDKDRNEQKWRDMIKYYNLDGTHLRATKLLVEDLKEKVFGNKGMAIPRHLIIDRDGSLVEKRAARPSDLENLKQQLEKI